MNISEPQKVSYLREAQNAAGIQHTGAKVYLTFYIRETGSMNIRIVSLAAFKRCCGGEVSHFPSGKRGN